MIAEKTKKYDTAIEQYQIGLDIAKKYNNKTWIGLLNGNMAVVYLRQKNYDKASVGLEIDIKNSLENKEYASALNAMSVQLEIAITKNKPLEAKELSTMISKLMNDYVSIRQDKLLAYKTLAKYNEVIKDYQQANFYQKTVNEIEYAREINSKKRAVEKLQAKFEYEKQQKIIDNNEKELANQTIYFYTGFALLFLLLVVLLIFLFLLFRQRKLIKIIKIQSSKTREQQKFIKKQNNKLRNIVKVKDKMFSIIAHDLRSPIGNFKTLLSMYDKHEITTAELTDASVEIRKQVDSLQNTIENLLLWANTQMKGIKNEPKNIPLSQIVLEMTSLYENIASQKNIKITNNVSSNEVVFADDNQLKVVLRNLISNAIKFTPKGGKVMVSTDNKGNKTQIAIQDTGTGMTKDELDRLFNLQTHFSKRGTNNEKGTGLGLLLVKQFVEANHGYIEVSSQKNVGTKFVFSLPTFAL